MSLSLSLSVGKAYEPVHSQGLRRFRVEGLGFMFRHGLRAKGVEGLAFRF